MEAPFGGGVPAALGGSGSRECLEPGQHGRRLVIEVHRQRTIRAEVVGPEIGAFMSVKGPHLRTSFPVDS